MHSLPSVAAVSFHPIDKIFPFASLTTAPTCREIHPEFNLAAYATCIQRSSTVGKTSPGCCIRHTYLIIINPSFSFVPPLKN